MIHLHHPAHGMKYLFQWNQNISSRLLLLIGVIQTMIQTSRSVDNEITMTIVTPAMTWASLSIDGEVVMINYGMPIMVVEIHGTLITTQTDLSVEDEVLAMSRQGKLTMTVQTRDMPTPTSTGQAIEDDTIVTRSGTTFVIRENRPQDRGNIRLLDLAVDILMNFLRLELPTPRYPLPARLLLVDRLRLVQAVVSLACGPSRWD
jgi:hypothetical protein